MSQTIIIALLFLLPIALILLGALASRWVTKNPGSLEFKIFGLFGGLTIFYVVEAFFVFCSGLNISTGGNYFAFVLNFPSFVYFLPEIFGGLIAGVIAAKYYPTNQVLRAAQQAMEE